MNPGQWTVDKSEKALPASTKNRIKARDRHRCRRCCSCWDLEIHHIHQRTLGGSDEDQNLITLCHNCHREWHRHEPQFEDWLTSIKPTIFLAAQLSDSHGLKFAEVMSLMPPTWEMIKTLNNAEADDLLLTGGTEPSLFDLIEVEAAS